MTEEEKKAMQYFYNIRATIDESNMLFDEDINVKCGKETVKQITTILNLIQLQQREIESLKQAGEATETVYKMQLEEKNKIIDELEDIFYNYQLCEYELTDCTYRKCEYIADDEIPPCKDCIKQYFEKKVEGKQ